MLKAVFGSCPQIKTMDFLLATYEGHFNKTQIANGAKISRPTLNKFIDNFLKYNLLHKIDDNTFELNNDSDIVKLLAKANILLAEKESKIIAKNNSYQKIEYTDEELDKILDDLFDEEDDMTEEEYQEKIAKEELILLNKKDYENAIINEKIASIKLKQYENIQKEIDKLDSRIKDIEEYAYYKSSKTRYDEKGRENINFLHWGFKNPITSRSY
jgi:hypothetical protein